MTGIVVIPAMLLYLLLALAVVYLSIRYARKSGHSAKRWGWSAALVMYLIPFWDWLPTVATHQYYCAKDAGFWVYKTVDQWKAENPGIADGLHFKLRTTRTPYGELYTLNERFAVEIRRKKAISILPTTITEERLVDVENENILAKAIRVGSNVNPVTDGLSGYKFWLGSRPCVTEGMEKLTAEIEHMGDKK
ncbi:MAG: hypothetical protein BGP20_14160 [Thiobacillus sp. 63-78]|uniref:hypothetical protein n=1 Tax=Thiobacillus sp. 63-78 TaxID=1895859 RepID=UPI000968C399|nr:hypothetical protein [Thiobacillus sp. 63-78]MBN8764559.1 hypothetical protein [Thiobacillus sp.]OJZ05946.1 MAG: hypothetical protein BGP20_14160 [Thiobacillus sp. 63-78]